MFDSILTFAEDPIIQEPTEEKEEEVPFYCPECQCTFLETGKSISVQHFYRCETCFPGSKIRLVCEACAATCHKGHALIDVGILSGYCDCGAGFAPSKCTRLFKFKKKLSLARIARSRRDNFRFKPSHICWAGAYELVDVNIIQLHPSDKYVFEMDEEEEEEGEEKEFKVVEPPRITENQSMPAIKLTPRQIITPQTGRMPKTVKMDFVKASLSYDRLNRKNNIRGRTAVNIRKKPPQERRFIIFINPRKKKYLTDEET